MLLGFSIVPMPVEIALMFLVGAAFIVVGIAIFTLGAEMAMTPMGDSLGDYVAKKKNLPFMVIMGLIMGFMITIAEPGLIVMAEQVADIPPFVLIVTIAAGVGVFLAIAFLRTVFNISLRVILFVFYAFLFAFAFFVPDTFLPMAFDSGGVTTGSMTVPFIMALGVAIARNNGKADSFGLIAICSIGPILTVMILGLLYTPAGEHFINFEIPQIGYTGILWAQFMGILPTYTWEVSLSLAPIVFLFLALKIFAMKLKIFAMKSWKVGARQVLEIFAGIVFTFGGLILFLTGANVGFLPAGNILGGQLSALEHNWLLLPISMIIGFFIIAAEPAVVVLNKQVADITQGAISRRAMNLSLAIGVAAAVGLSMLRVLTSLPIMWLLLPGYIIALGLSFIVPKEFTSIAFDAGGVASGPLTSAFLLPLAIGASAALDGNVVKDAFGIIAMVALTPLITIQILGFCYKIRSKSQI